ncbi:M48 family metallopeptidase [Shewanella yunxiaonensis]|uniref:Putative beta-barrel assembly-enhancing protease n=1 Tax=Shewanella yunxiaonensis TaxID=2829809 RepID=A0ABX7YNX0_9GAMM|nr:MULTISPECIES: M48 family metalloprotease [Shewanella]MDF0535763.1 M48 family metalloprotease [Shewanella sp. A32]QUN04453.1 M48 family metallopeptidase [Shewanella yunxiaonensis]
MFSCFKRLILTSVAAASLGVCAHSFASSDDLPDLGTAASHALSIDKEMIYGDAYMRVIRAQAPVLYDPLLAQYITELGNRLVAHANNVRTPFYFFMLQNDEINAFAFFGGHVAVHTGLFLYADNESEMASVLAHEISHVTQRHLARSIEAQQKTGPVTLAGMLGAILLTIAAPQAGMAALASTQALSAQSQINYTRQHEQEADRFGMQTMVAAGFDPNAAATFFSKLAAKYRYTSKPPQMLLTHPLPESRISEARDRAAQYPHITVAPSLNFHLAKARIQVRFSSYTDTAVLSLFNEQLAKKDYVFKEAALYGKALALFRMKDYKGAEAIIDPLLKQDPDNLFYLDTKTDLLTEAKKYDQAIKLLEAQRQMRPSSLVINTNLANAYLEDKQAAKAIPILEQMTFDDKENLLPFQMLNEAYEQTGNKAMQYYEKAEVMALRADFSGAIDQLNFAYRESDGQPLQIARIEAKLRQFRDAEEQMKSLKQ